MSIPVHTPADDREAAAIVREAAESGGSLEIASGRTKRKFGRPLTAGAVLDMSRVTGIIDYQPEELVLTVRAGTTLSEIEAALGERRQMLGFEPLAFVPLFGAPAGTQSAAGIVAADISGPRRVSAGSVRDHVIGCRFINGDGEIIRAGGPVIKNVTGFDIPKLMCGSFGTLGVLTEITFRVQPRAPRVSALVIRDCAPWVGLRLLIAAAQTPAEPSGLAFVPGPDGSHGRALIRFEGTAAAIAEKIELLRGRLEMAESGTAGDMETAELFRAVAAGAFLRDECDVWRLCVPPSTAPQAVEASGASAWYADWGGGLLWLDLPATQENADRLRRVTSRLGGHATLVRASAEARARISVFEPETAVRASLTKSVKQAFDPKRIFNPGRMFDYL